MKDATWSTIFLAHEITQWPFTNVYYNKSPLNDTIVNYTDYSVKKNTIL